MNAARLLRRELEGCELKHSAYSNQHQKLTARIDDALEGFSPRIEWVVGPSRVGKTRLLESLDREYPETKINGRRQVPVLMVPLVPGVSPIMLPTSVLKALKVPLPTRGLTSGLMFNRMVDQLRLAGTKVLLIEEASHLIDVGAKVPPRAAADWFKTASDQLGLTVVMTGLPRLERLFNSNEQLRLRASKKSEFRPYDFRVQQDQGEFARCVRTYADMFARHGWTFAISFEALVTNCYLMSGGAVGIVSKFMQDMATHLSGQEPRTLTLTDCRHVVDGIGSNEHPDGPAFMREAISQFELNQAHAHTLMEADMSMPLSTPAQGVH